MRQLSGHTVNVAGLVILFLFLLRQRKRNKKTFFHSCGGKNSMLHFPNERSNNSMETTDFRLK